MIVLSFPGPWIEDTGHQNPKCDLGEALHAHKGKFYDEKWGEVVE